MPGELGRNFRNVYPEHGFGVIRGLSSPGAQLTKGIEMVVVNGRTVPDGGRVVDHHAGSVSTRRRAAI